MKSKRELMRKNKYLIDRVVNQVQVITRLGIDLYRFNPENDVFTDGTFTDEAMETIRKAANVKTKIETKEKENSGN